MNDNITESAESAISTAPEKEQTDNIPEQIETENENGIESEAPKKRQIALLCVLVAVILLVAGALIMILKGNQESRKSNSLDRNKSVTSYCVR